MRGGIRRRGLEIDRLLDFLYHLYQVKPDNWHLKGKNISFQSGKLLSYFHEQDIPCFDFEGACLALSEVKHSTLRELLSDMTRRGLLMRLKQGVYYIIPFEADAEHYMPNWHLLAKYLVNNSAHYIGYYSALQIHDLITQPSLKEQIVVAEQVKPSEILIKRVPFQFIYHNPKHFFGGVQVWIDGFHKVYTSDLEKTIIDCLYKPHYAGGIVDVANAIHRSRDNINYVKLLDYSIRYNTQVVVKRLGFLLERLRIDAPIIEELYNLRTSSYTLLDTELPPKGIRDARWRIIQNLDFQTIQSALHT